MMVLAIARWRTRYHATAAPAEEALRAWDEAPRRLAAPAAADTEAILCIRRIAIAARVREGIDGTAQLAALLGAALEARIAAALREASLASPDIILWRDRREALADMLYRAAGGDPSRAWAWRQAGLLPATGAADARGMLAAAVAALAAEPGLAWNVLARLVLAEAETGSLGLLLAALDGAQWQALLGEAPPGPDAPADTAPPTAPVAPARDPVARALRAYAMARPREAARHGLALRRLLARAIAGGAVPTPTQHRAATAALASWAGTAPHASHRRADPAPRAKPEEAGAGAQDQALEAEPAPPPAPPLPAPAAPLRSAWGGLLFLLPLLPPAGLLQALADLPSALPGALRALGLALGVPPEDPALPAFCGGTLPDPVPLPPPLLADTIAAIEALLRARLGLPAEGACWLPDLCRRDARISIEPGWIEAEFPLDSADPALRRGAIDLDPGYLPWLGCVVRFRYA